MCAESEGTGSHQLTRIYLGGNACCVRVVHAYLVVCEHPFGVRVGVPPYICTKDMYTYVLCACRVTSVHAHLSERVCVCVYACVSAYVLKFVESYHFQIKERRKMRCA